jgi:hypothetical protein
MFNSERELVDDIAAATGASIVITWTANEPTAAVTQTIADGDGAALTDAAIVITWTANEPTAGVTQTIADGTVPTVAELGQYVQNINTQHDKAVVDATAMKAEIAELFQYVANINAQLTKVLADIAALRTGVNS